jgi:hypothetical protein
VPAPSRRPRRRRTRRPRDGAAREGAAGGEARIAGAPPRRDGAPGNRERGPRRDDDRERRGPASRDPRRRNDRDGPRRADGRGRSGEGARRPERKLYSFDSVVDRGFDDVEEESGTRRVHWTIVKRTVADQVSCKAMSAIYVVQRDGADSEFPSLGAARSAVNKTIVHPEKLTRSKAEYAAEKK